MTWTGIQMGFTLPPFVCPGCWQGSTNADALRAHIDVCPSWETASAADLSEGDHVWIEMDDYVGPLTVAAPPGPAVGGGIGVEFEVDEDEDDCIAIFDDDEVIRVVFYDDSDDFEDDDDDYGSDVFVDEPYVREQPLRSGPPLSIAPPQRPVDENDPALEAMLDEVMGYSPNFAEVPRWVYLSNVRRESVSLELLDVVHEIVNDPRYDGRYNNPVVRLIADKNLVAAADRRVVNDMAGDVWARTVGQFMLTAAEQIADRLLEDPSQGHLTRRKDIDAFVSSRLSGTRAGLVSSAQVAMVVKTAHRRNA